jgi:hypothetical protein
MQVFNALSHETGRAGAQKLVPLLRVRGTTGLRDELVDIIAEQLLAGISKHALGGAVCDEDRTSFVDLKDGVRRIVDQLAEAAVGKRAGDREDVRGDPQQHHQDDDQGHCRGGLDGDAHPEDRTPLGQHLHAIGQPASQDGCSKAEQSDVVAKAAARAHNP